MNSNLRYLNKTEREALQEFKEKLTQKLTGELLELKLFGSKARGDYHEDSDIDVLIVLKDVNEKKKDVIYDAAIEVLHKYEVYISTHIYSLKEFDYLNSIPTVFMQLMGRDAVSI